MLQKTKKNFLYFSSQDFPFKFLILIFFFFHNISQSLMDLIFYMLPFREVLWWQEENVQRFDLDNREPQSCATSFFFALTLPRRKHSFRLKLLKMIEVSLRMCLGHRKKKSFKFHSRYSLPLLYRLNWKVPLGRERGSWVFKVYHKWEVCEQSLPMRLRIVSHYFLKANLQKGVLTIQSHQRTKIQYMPHYHSEKRQYQWSFFKLLTTFWHFSFKSHHLWQLTQQLKNFVSCQL